VSWETVAECGTTVEFHLTAIDAEAQVIAQGSASAATGVCPTMWGPSNVRFIGHTPDGLTTIAWDHGAGQTAYLIRWTWQILSSGETGSDEAGIQGNRDSFDVPVPCDSVFSVEVTGRTPEIPAIGSANGGDFTSADCADVRYYEAPILARSADATANPGDGAPVQTWARCPDGTALVGGGFRGWSAIGAPERAWVTQNEPSFGLDWIAAIRAPGSRSVGINATAVCLPGARVERDFARIEVSEGGTGIARASCPAGTIPTSGGWSASPGLNVLASVPTDDGWSVLAFDELGAGGMKILTASVVCIRDDRVSTVVVEQVRAVPYGDAMPIMTPSCPDGSYLVGGGASSLNTVYEGSEPLDDRWQVSARNPDLGAGDGPAHAVSVFGICLDVSP
jgi:hypothetical protein